MQIAIVIQAWPTRAYDTPAAVSVCMLQVELVRIRVATIISVPLAEFSFYRLNDPYYLRLVLHQM